MEDARQWCNVVATWRVIVRAVEYFMLNPRTAFVKNAPSPLRRVPLREIRNDRTVHFGSDAAVRLLMWLFFFNYTFDGCDTHDGGDDDRAKFQRLLTDVRKRQKTKTRTNGFPMGFTATYMLLISSIWII